MICTDERYLEAENGMLFSTGNHPVEMLMPMYHLLKAGFAFDIATLSSNSVKREFWAMPKEDWATIGSHRAHLEQLRKPLKLSNVVTGLGPDNGYAAVFIPGGHNPLISLPFRRDVAAAIYWAVNADRHIIAICHGPAFLACAAEGAAASSSFAGYAITAFPDATDLMAPGIGYPPGHLTLG